MRNNTFHSIASNLVAIANNRNFATALISLDPDALKAFAAEHGLTGDFATLSQSPEVRANLQASVDQLNAQLNRWETIKKFTVLDRDLSEEDGELTASLKVNVTDRPGHDRRYAINEARARNELGYAPARDFSTGFAATLAWYLDNECWWRGVLDGSYRNWVVS